MFHSAGETSSSGCTFVGIVRSAETMGFAAHCVGCDPFRGQVICLQSNSAISCRCMEMNRCQRMKLKSSPSGLGD